MSSEWREFYLNDVYNISSGLSKSAEYFGYGYPFLSFKEVFNNFFLPKTLSNFVEATEKERLTCSIKRGDVFLTRTSETIHELGMSCVALKDYKNATFNGFTKRLRPKGNVEIVPEYAGYYFRNSKFRKELTAMSSASTRASLNNEMIGRLKIILPEPKEQSFIAFILKTLDAKIDNLRRQTETLEKIAQLLFKRWFIDFEFPNEEGNPYKSSGGEMQPSELGDIPLGWTVGKLGDITRVINGRAYKNSEFKIEGTPIIRIQNLTGQGKTVYSDLILDEDKYIQAGDLIYAWSATFGTYIWRGIKSIYHYHIWKLECYDESFKYYLYIHLKRVSDGVKNQGTGSIFTHITKTLMESQELLIPENKIMAIWKCSINPIFEKIMNNIKQIQTLTKTRDLLLPKLMSGEIRIKE